MTVWKVLHVVTMFSAVTLLVGGSVSFDVLARTRDPAALARFWSVQEPLTNVGVGLIVAGIVFGLVTAIVGPFDLTQPWLIIAYVLVAVLFVLGPIEGRLAKRAADAAAQAGDVWTDELEALASDRRRESLTYASTLIYVIIIVDMVAKPFS
jgi:hypothetical protein